MPMTLGIEFRICGQSPTRPLGSAAPVSLSVPVALPCGEYLCVHTRDLSDGFNAFCHSSPAHI